MCTKQSFLLEAHNLSFYIGLVVPEGIVAYLDFLQE